MNENAVSQKLISIYNSLPQCRARKRHGGKFQQGDPDIAGCIKGKAFFVEVKLEEGQLTKLQATELDKWQVSGAATALAIWNSQARCFRVGMPMPPTSWLTLEGRIKVRMPGIWKEGMTLNAAPWSNWLQEYVVGS